MAATIQHIAISCKENETLAEFYKRTFGMREVFRHSPEGRPDVTAIYLTDGHVNLALLPNLGDGREGINHFGFKVDDVEEAMQLGIASGGKPSTTVKPRDGRYAETAIVDPSGTSVDLTDKGWDIGQGRPE
jgi:catechol 2,3-dioxygenase-like lactoylglutathione lyase family enzyme